MVTGTPKFVDAQIFYMKRHSICIQAIYILLYILNHL